MKQKIIFIGVFFLIIIGNVFGNDFDGYIYGKVYTVEDQVFEGVIRWGEEEIFWDDHFNANKDGNENIKELTKKEKKRLVESIRLNKKNEHRNNDNLIIKLAKLLDILDVDDGNISYNYNYNFGHLFMCQFGNIKEIKITGQDSVEVVFRDGSDMEFEGGSNDMGADVTVYISEIGKTKIDWDFIKKIEFSDTPNIEGHDVGKPLYGEVITDNGRYEGFIIWDKDERISDDKLDGNYKGRSFSINFKNIKTIEKMGSGSEIKLKSGKDLYLYGSNDVNDENRGIIVKTARYRVVISWDEFEKIEFKNYTNKFKKYSDYKNISKLSGKVYKNKGNLKYDGEFVFDLDEEYNFEIYHGKNMNDIEYLIPFRYIEKLKRLNYNYSSVELINGEKFKFGDTQDSTDDNTGILFKRMTEGLPRYILWEDVDYITF